MSAAIYRQFHGIRLWKTSDVQRTNPLPANTCSGMTIFLPLHRSSGQNSATRLGDSPAKYVINYFINSIYINNI